MRHIGVALITKSTHIAIPLKTLDAKRGQINHAQADELMRDHSPDVLVVAIDTNCSTFSQARKQIADATRDEFRHMLVTACPDPHIERWYLADPDSFSSVVGYRPAPGSRKCQRGHYKRILREAIQKGGHPSTLGGIEFAAELVGEMDLFRAGRSDASLKAFFDSFHETLRTSARSRSPE